MATGKDDAYSALIGKIENRLASRSREARRDVKQDNHMVLGLMRMANTEDLRVLNEKAPEAEIWSKTEEEPNSTGGKSMQHFNTKLQKQLYRTRSRILEEESRAKEEPETRAHIHCILPIVMDQVKKYLSAFKKEMILEIRHEINKSIDMSLKEVHHTINLLGEALIQQRQRTDEHISSILSLLVHLSNPA